MGELLSFDRPTNVRCACRQLSGVERLVYVLVTGRDAENDSSGSSLAVDPVDCSEARLEDTYSLYSLDSCLSVQLKDDGGGWPPRMLVLAGVPMVLRCGILIMGKENETLVIVERVRPSVEVVYLDEGDGAAGVRRRALLS